MAKQRYKSIDFRPDTRAMIDTVNDLIEEYQEKNLRLTLRQLYYQCIARDLFPSSWIDPVYNAKNGLEPDTKNTEKNYKRLGGILSDARLAGLVDWDAIEDRARRPTIWQEHANLRECVEEATAYYRLPRWGDQPEYIELWVEKDALSGVLSPMASKWHVPLGVNKGYSSSSAMYEAAQRFAERCNLAESEYYDADKDEREGTILYLGDHDPSGEDMVRDIRERFETFGVPVTVVKIALTMEQIRRYRPPPNPAKQSDSRFKQYVAKFGTKCWEVDALRPEVMQDMVERAIKEHVDGDRMSAVIAREKQDKAKLAKALRSIEEDE